MTIEEALVEIDTIGKRVAEQRHIYGPRAGRQRIVALESLEAHVHVRVLILALQELDRRGYVTLWTDGVVFWQAPLVPKPGTSSDYRGPLPQKDYYDMLRDYNEDLVSKIRFP